jgi:hypothetical protein
LRTFASPSTVLASSPQRVFRKSVAFIRVF